MSMRRVEEFSAQLPLSLREQVVGYALSVDRALPTIFREIGREFNREQADQVVFWSAIRKAYGVISSTYWVLEHSGRLLEEASEARRITIGGKDFSRGGEEHSRIQALTTHLDELFSELDLRDSLTETPRETLQRVILEQ